MPIVEGDYLHSCGKQSAIERFYFFLELAQRRNRLLATLQQHDAFDNIVNVIDAHLAQTRLKTFFYFGHVAQIHRDTIAGSDQDVLHLGNVVQEAQSANVHVLAAHREVVPACVGVA